VKQPWQLKKGGAEFPYLIEITTSPEIDGGDDELDLLVVY
jgi:hypothetical protein